MWSLRAATYNERKLETCPVTHHSKSEPSKASAEAGGRGSILAGGASNQGWGGMRHAKVSLYLKTSLHSRATGSHQRPHASVRQSEEPTSFPELATCVQPGKRQLHGAPWLPRPGLSPQQWALRLRAEESRGPAMRRRAASPHPPPRLRPLPPGATRSPPRPFPWQPAACGAATAPAQAHWGRVRGAGRGGVEWAGRNGRGRASPPQHSAQQRRVETLRRWEAPLYFRHRDLVLRGGAEERQATRNWTEDFVGVHHATEEVVLVDRDGGDGVAVGLGQGHRACGDRGGRVLGGGPTALASRSGFLPSPLLQAV